MLAVLGGLIAGAGLYDRAGVLAFALGVPVIYAGIMFCSYEYDLPGQWRVFAAGLVVAVICSLRMYQGVQTKPFRPQTLNDASGTVRTLRTWGRSYVSVIDVDEGASYIVRLPFAELMPGTRIAFDGVTRPFRKSNTGFDESRYWGARGVSGWMNIYDVRELPPKFSMAMMRYKLYCFLSIYAPNLTGSYLKAAWLGERNDDLSENHRRWGTSHLLAVSGFHVGLVIMCVGLLGMNSVMLSVLLWGYIILTGAAPSAVRAGLMFQAGLIARVMGRPSCGVNNVCLAGVILLMYSPLYFWDVGFRLSIISALVITSMAGRKALWLLISPAVWLVTFPQAAYTFKSVPVIGLVLNLAAPVYFAFAFTLASAGALLKFMHVPLAGYYLLAVEGGFVIWERAANFAAGVLPERVGWNYWVAWLGAGVLVYLVCRYFELSVIRTIAIMCAVSFLAFVIFM